jgi:hypothetical protein
VPVIPDVRKAQFRLSGADFAPQDVAWLNASRDDREAYWDNVAVLARDAKYRELTKGVGVDGRRLPPRRRKRHDRATGPVLSPHWSDSRFRTQLMWSGSHDGAVLWWKAPWGRIVGFHARGEVRGAPIRNVVGLTDESAEAVRRKARKWWAGQVDAGSLGAAKYEVQGRVVQADEDGDVLWSTGWRKAPQRPKDSIFARQSASMRPVAPVSTPTRFLPPWELQRSVAGWMTAAARRAVAEPEIDAYVADLGRTQSLESLRVALVRLGVVEPALTLERVLELLRRQIVTRLKTGRMRPVA